MVICDVLSISCYNYNLLTPLLEIFHLFVRQLKRKKSNEGWKDSLWYSRYILLGITDLCLCITILGAPGEITRPDPRTTGRSYSRLADEMWADFEIFYNFYKLKCLDFTSFNISAMLLYQCIYYQCISVSFS